MSFGAAIVSHGIDMGALVAQALHACEMQHKEAWLIGGYPNASQWSKAIDGDAPLDLWRLRHLPIRWWQCFLPLLASALIRQFWADQSSDLRMVKADLRSDVQQKRSA